MNFWFSDWYIEIKIEIRKKLKLDERNRINKKLKLDERNRINKKLKLITKIKIK